MYRYTLIDIDGNEFEIQDETFKLESKSFSVELDIIERTFQAGADFPGIQRDKSGVLNFTNDVNKSDEQIFRNTKNTLIQKLRNTILIRDNINKIETDVRLQEITVNYDIGGYNLGTTGNTISRHCLTPWGLPGRLMIRQLPLTPPTARLSMDMGVRL